MAEHRVCPWWLGYFLACPLRRFAHNPAQILSAHVREGMTVFEPGPGMGFFTLELARRVGPRGRVIAVDIQPRMAESLKRRLSRSGLAERVDVRLASGETLGIDDLAGQVDFVLAFAVVHETPSSARFFSETARVMKAGGRLLLAEPSGHVTDAQFEAELRDAASAGLAQIGRAAIRRSVTALLEKAPLPPVAAP